MQKFFNKEIFFLFLFIATGLLFRSIKYAENLNFSTDQALFATESLEIWRNKEIELIGPSISFKLLGRELFQGSLTYYFQLLFLLPANFEPVSASYLFTFFAMIMVVPLYYGTKKLINKQAAMVISLMYSLAPLYIDYTRFFWNPNFQLALTPLLILAMGLYHQTRKKQYFFLLSFLTGMLLLFHYQFVLVILGLGIYYFIIQKEKATHFMLFLLGLGLGFSPILLFELRNSFYNTQTLLLYLQNINKVVTGVSSSFNLHYYVSILLFISLAGLTVIKKQIKSNHIAILAMSLLLLSGSIYVKKPSHAFGMKENWNYLYEKKAYDIIVSQDLQNYNVINLGYDTTATVQKYLMKKNNIVIPYDDYYNNEYLYIITNREDYMEDPAYEINTFTQSEVIQTWELNDVYSLILRRRLNYEDTISLVL